MDRCASCDETKPYDEMMRLHCDHRYCQECVEFMVESAVKNEECFPPRCCAGTIPFDLLRRWLSPKLTRVYAARALEISTKDKTYCHIATCSAFIAPHSVHNENAYCQNAKCMEVTCARCKQKEHFGPCESRPLETAAKQLAEENGWKICPACKNVVERESGCNHMICRCGGTFCYECGAIWRTCDCEADGHDEDEDDDDEGGVYDEQAERDYWDHLMANEEIVRRHAELDGQQQRQNEQEDDQDRQEVAKEE